MNDLAVSELLGYALLAGVVIIAAIGITAGAGDLIASCVRQAGLAEATSSIGAFSRAASGSMATGNEYPQALEMVIPSGYELVLLDGEDDWRAMEISSGGTRLASLRPGSVSLRSAFRSATYESGGAFVNDSGRCHVEREPALFTAGKPGGRTSLHICVPCLRADTAVVPQGRDVVLSLRHDSARDYTWPVAPGSRVSVVVRTDCQDGWRQVLEKAGFTVTVSGDTVTGSMGGIDDVRLTTVVLLVGLE